MAVTATPISSKGSLKLNKGQDPDTGKTITGTSSINGIVAGADNTKLYNIAAALADCVAYPVVQVIKAESYELENS